MAKTKQKMKIEPRDALEELIYQAVEIDERQDLATIEGRRFVAHNVALSLWSEGYSDPQEHKREIQHLEDTVGDLQNKVAEGLAFAEERETMLRALGFTEKEWELAKVKHG